MNLKKLKETWAVLPASKKRLFMVVGLSLLAIIVISAINSFRTSPREAREAQNKAARFDLVSPDMSKESWVEQGRREVNDLSELVKNMAAEQQKLRDQLDSVMNGNGKGYSAGTPTATERELGLRQDLGRLGALPIEKGQEIYPPIPVEPKIPGAQSMVPGLGIPGPGVSIPAPSGQTSPPAAVVVPPDSQGKDRVGVIEPRVMGSQKYGPKQDGQPAAKPVSAKKQQEAEYDNFYIPTASHVRVKLLTGVDAPTGPKAQGMPVPLIARIQDLSFLPNEMRQNISGCYLLAEGMGELASERVKIRGLNLSCVNHNNQQVIDEEVTGYFADIDGKNALRGRVVSKQGRFLAAALTASFIEGVGKAFQASTSTTFNTPYGTSEQSSLDSFQDGFKQGVGAGFGASAKKLSDFYLKMAEDMYPVIELQANMNATFIFLNGKRFNADKSLFLPVVGMDQTQTNDYDL